MSRFEVTLLTKHNGPEQDNNYGGGWATLLRREWQAAALQTPAHSDDLPLRKPIPLR